MIKEVSFISEDQEKLYKAILYSDAEILYLPGGGDSGKTYGTGMATAAQSLLCPGTRAHIFKNDLGKVRNLFLPPIYSFFRNAGLEEVNSLRSCLNKDNTFFILDRREIYLFNESKIFLNTIDRGSHWQDGRNKHHGVGGDLFVFDEIDQIPWSWPIEYFYESGRLRISPEQAAMPENKRKIFNRKIVLTENQDFLSWGYKMTVRGIHPKTQQPLSEIFLDDEKTRTYQDVIETVRCETWNNRLKTKKQLEIMKNGGNADKFYFSNGSMTNDVSQVYRFDIVENELRYWYVYGMDFGQKAYTTLLQVGFGSDLTVTAREFYYKQGVQIDKISPEDNENDTIFGIVRNLIEYHRTLLDQLAKAGGVKWIDYLTPLHKVPHLIIDSARSDIKEMLDKKFGPRISVILSDKTDTKTVSTEKVKKLKLNVVKDSKFFINELENYRYKQSDFDNDERLPDGNDDAIDTYRYDATYILKLMRDSENYTNFDMFREQHFEMLKSKIDINAIVFQEKNK